MIISNIVQFHYLRLFHKTLTTDSQIINKPKTKTKETKTRTTGKKGIVTEINIFYHNFRIRNKILGQSSKPTY